MKIANSLWQNALLLWKSLPKMEIDEAKRELFARELSIPVQQARAIIFALENKDIISSQAEQIESRATDRELVIGDLHVPFNDEVALDSVLNQAVKQGVNMVSILGDLIDFYQISTFRKDPTRSDRIYKEITQARKVLEKIREAIPEAPITYLEGNHEQRFMLYIFEKAPQFRELVDGMLQTKLGLSELGIEYKNKYYCIGELWHLHGHERRGMANTVYITNVMFQNIFDHFITLHYHKTMEQIFKRIDDSIFGAFAVGHLATSQAYEDYAPLNKYNQGFAIVDYEDNGEYHVHNHKIHNGKIY